MIKFINGETYTHSAIVFLAIGKVPGSGELLPDDNGRAEQQRLADAHHSAGRVVQRQRCIVNVLRAQIGDIVNAGCDEHVPRVRDHSRLRQSGRSGRVNVEHLVVVLERCVFRDDILRGADLHQFAEVLDVRLDRCARRIVVLVEHQRFGQLRAQLLDGRTQ